MKKIYKWGAIIGIALFALQVLGVYLGVLFDPTAKMYLWVLQIILLGFGIYLFAREYKSNNGGVISFGRTLLIGVLLSAMSGVIVSIGGFVFYSYIVPDEKEKMINASVEMIVLEQDSSSRTVEEYKTNFEKNYKDTVQTTLADTSIIRKMIADSTERMLNRIKGVKGNFSFSGLLITTTGSNVLKGFFITLLIAAVIANKRA